MVKKHTNRVVFVFTAIISFIFGFICSGIIIIYSSIPESSVIPVAQKTNYRTTVANLDVETITNQDLSIHFLELGNQFTGDCTLIKVGNTEILIDAGSRTDSVPVIKDYLDRFVTDHKLEYVIVTHADQDHIAGFGTPVKTESIFDLYKIDTVIQFVHTQKTTTVYKNYCREISDLKQRGTNVYNALQCINETDGASRIYNLSPEIKLEILDQDYYHHNDAKSENDNSVCCQIIQNDNRYYLFS